MLINYQNKIATVKCGNCGMETEHDLSNVKSEFLEEFEEYENLMLSCGNSECSAREGFNMNLPMTENMEGMPIEEQTQRTYLRQIIQTIRADFSNV